MGMSFDLDGVHNSEQLMSIINRVPGDSNDRPLNLNDLLMLPVEEIGNTNASIPLLQQVINLIPDSDVDKPVYLHNYGHSLKKRFEKSKNIADIEAAIGFHRSAVSLSSDDDPNKPAYLNLFALALRARFEHLSIIPDIENAIDLHQQAVNRTPNDDPDKPGYLSNLGISLWNYFSLSRNIADLDAAICCQQQAVDLIATGDAYKPDCLCNLGGLLLARFDRVGNIRDINASISNLQEAVHLVPNDPMYLDNLGSSLQARFDQLGGIADLKAAIGFHRLAVDLTDDTDVTKLKRLNNLGNSYHAQFERLGNITDIDAAIRIHQQAVDLTPESDPSKHERLNNLGLAFQARFEQLNDIDDINIAINYHEQAVNKVPDSHVNQPVYLNNLGGSLLVRFKRSGDVADIKAAISNLDQAVKLTNDGAAKPGRLNNLGGSLLAKFNRCGDVVDIDAAIRIYRQAVELTPDRYAEKPGYLNNLGLSLQARFERLEGTVDIDAAISVLRQAVKLSPGGHAEKPVWLNNLGNSLFLRFTLSSKSSDAHCAKKSYQNAAVSLVGVPSRRFYAARRWTQLSSLTKGSDLLYAHRVAVELIPFVIWVGSTIRRRYEDIPLIGNAVNEAAAAAITSGKHYLALKWLEQGRSVVWQQILQLRTPIDDLRMVNRILAERFEEVSRALERAGTSQSMVADLDKRKKISLEREAREHRMLAQERDNLLQKIRHIHGFKGFLQPRQFAELVGAARHSSIVIINVHRERCDALVIRQGANSVGHIPLSTFSYEKATDAYTRLRHMLRGAGVLNREPSIRDAGPFMEYDSVDDEYEEILGMLWTDVVKPVLDFLNFPVSSDDKLPRVTWCATGPLSFLPIHAAGLYSTDRGSRVFNHVVSSYTPTVAALLDSPQLMTNFGGVLAISQPSTPNQRPLPGTVQEVDNICRRSTSNNLHLRFTWLDGDAATPETVLKEMETHSWVHLACHGIQHNDPLKSAFHLHGGTLELGMITNKSFKHAELAFLSACQTATGDATLPEEVVHLAAGMLFAGYRTVLGTMWSIKDDHAPHIADKVYSHLLKGGQPDSRQAAYALHEAVADLRKQNEKNFVSWVPYIHIGI